MPPTTTTDLVRELGMSVVSSDIPAKMTLAQYRKRPHVAESHPRIPVRLLRRGR